MKATQDAHLNHSINLIKTETYTLNIASRLDLVGFNDDPVTLTATDLNADMLQSRSIDVSLGNIFDIWIFESVFKFLEFSQKFGSCPPETYGVKVVYLMYKQVNITGLSVSLYVRNGKTFQFEIPCEMLSLNERDFHFLKIYQKIPEFHLHQLEIFF